jgi:hypothetical protein
VRAIGRLRQLHQRGEECIGLADNWSCKPIKIACIDFQGNEEVRNIFPFG